jgi:hypothetical protein
MDAMSREELVASVERLSRQNTMLVRHLSIA